MSLFIGVVLAAVGATLVWSGWSDESGPKLIAGILVLVLGISVLFVRTAGSSFCGPDDAYAQTALSASASNLLVKPVKPAKPSKPGKGSSGGSGFKHGVRVFVHFVYCS